MARDERKPAFIQYGRVGPKVAFSMENCDEPEIRALLIGLWLILPSASRIDMIRELAHYHEAPDATPPAASSAIADGYAKARG
jgi:hypothetical protein